MQKQKKATVKQIIAFAIAACMLVTAVPSVAVASEATDMLELLEPVDLGPAISTSVSTTEFSARSTVSGRDYLYIPVRGEMLLVYDLTAYQEDPTNDAAVNVDIEDTDFLVPRGVIEEGGYVYVCGDSSHLYKYDPVAKTGEKVNLGANIGNTYLTMWGLTKDGDGNIYASGQKSGIIKYNTKTGATSVLWTDSVSSVQSVYYDNGYVYSSIPGFIQKHDATTGEVVAKQDVREHNEYANYYLTVVNGVLFVGSNETNGLIALNTGDLTPANIEFSYNNKGNSGIVTSAASNGKHYLVVNGCGLCEYDPTTNTIKVVNAEFTTGLKIRESFITVNDKEYLITNRNGGARVQLVDLETYEVTEWTDLTDNANTSATMGSIANGLPGSNEIYIGGYQNSSVSVYNTETQKYTNKLFSNTLDQTDSMIAYNGKIWLGCYNGGYIVGYDPATKEVSQLATTLGNTFNMVAIKAFAAGDNKLFFAGEPNYYHYFGGVIGWYDFDEGKLYVVTGYGKLNDETYEEKVFWTDKPTVGPSSDPDTEEAIWTDEEGKTYTPTEIRNIAMADDDTNFVPGTEGYQEFATTASDSFRGIVYNQLVINMEYHEGYLYCVTSRYGGYGASLNDERAQSEAKLMIYNVNEKKKEGEFFVRTGSEGVNGGIDGLTTPNYISGVGVGKDGKLWGLVAETLFSFTFDAESKTVAIQEELSFGKTDYPVGASKQKKPRPILFDDQGYMYVGFDTYANGIRRIKCNDPSVNQRICEAPASDYVLGEDGNLYYQAVNSIVKVALTAVARVEQLINSIGTVTLESSEAINTARTAYNALSAEEKAEVINYVTLQNAETAFDALANDYRAEVTVDYAFFNDVLPVGEDNGYGYKNQDLNIESNLNALTAAYGNGTINNVYSSHYSPNYNMIPAMTETSGGWQGISFWCFVEDWLALKIKSPGTGSFNLSLDYKQNSNNANEVVVYILPSDTQDIATALETAVVQAKVDLKAGSGDNMTVSLGNAAFEAGKDYIIVFNPTKNSSGGTATNVNARMHLTGLTMTAQLATLEAAQAMATTPFHTVKLLYDEQAKAVKEQIEAIGEVTLEKEAAIVAARAAYNALSDLQKALVDENVLIAAEAKLAELKADGTPKVEVTVDYDFFNTAAPTHDTWYGYNVVDIAWSKQLDILNPAYEAGTINNVIFDRGYESGAAKMAINPSTGWKGIIYWSVVDGWLAMKVKSPGTGVFDVSLDYQRNANSPQETDVYILPGDTTDIAAALTDAEAQASVNLYAGEGSQTVSLGKAEFEAGKDYIIVFNPTVDCDGTGSSLNARMYLEGLKMSIQLSTMEAANTIATTPFHTVTLLDEVANAVKTQIEAIGEVTLESEAAIVAARAAYENLTAEQKALIDESVLIAAEAKLAELKAAVTGYTAGISAISNVVNKGEQVSINVAVDYKAAEGQEAETGFNAGEISFSYDSTKLTFNEQASTLGDATVNIISDGVLKLADYGADKSFGTNVYVLAFDAIADGQATVELTAAAFINKDNATSNDLATATLGQADVAVIIQVAHAVTLPEGFTGNLIAEDGEDYTFEAIDKNYEYTLEAIVGGQSATVTDNGDGTYTVGSVTGDLVISVVTKTGKSYGVTFEGTGKDDVTGAATATYGTDYAFTLPTESGTLYGVDGITIGGEAYTGYSVSEKTYTIPGSAITGEVVITVTKESVAVGQVTVEVDGSGAGAAVGFVNTAEKYKAYTLTLTPEAGYNYQVTATMGGTEVTNLVVEGDTYKIENVTGNIVFTVTASVNTDGVSVAEYLTLDGAKMWLVKNTTKPADGKVSTYDGAAMFWSEEYNAYCYLVVADDLQTDAAKDLISITEGTSVAVDYDMDVNITGKVDASDAQLVYNMYNAAYASFDDSVTMEKFLRADVTADQKIDVNDAAAIIASVLGIASN